MFNKTSIVSDSSFPFHLEVTVEIWQQNFAEPWAVDQFVGIVGRGPDIELLAAPLYEPWPYQWRCSWRWAQPAIPLLFSAQHWGPIFGRSTRLQLQINNPTIWKNWFNFWSFFNNYVFLYSLLLFSILFNFCWFIRDNFTVKVLYRYFLVIFLYAF